MSRKTHPESLDSNLSALDMHALNLTGRREELCAMCLDNHPAAVADALKQLPPEEIWKILQTVPSETRADIFSHIEEAVQTGLVLSLDRGAAARLLTDMSPDDRADLFRRLPEDRRTGILPALAHAEREDIRRLTSYDENSAGSVMTSDYATLEPGLTASEAIQQLRIAAPDRETIYYAYVLGPDRRLMGFVSLKDLILAPPDRPLARIMQSEAVSARVDEDRETAARRLQKYDLIALPIVDANEALVGILTHDDAFDILSQEQQEDLEKLVAITGSHEAGIYMKKSPWQHFRNRVLWILGLAAIGLVSGQIVAHYEDLLVFYPMLAMFLPLLADAGGNTGSQSATLVIRALALSEVVPRDALRVVWKEFRVASLLGGVLGGIAFLRIWGFPGPLAGELSALRAGLAVGLALMLQVVSATVIGAVLPLIAARAKVDPAVVASPALTTMVDITGLLIYFSIASAILGI